MTAPVITPKSSERRKRASRATTSGVMNAGGCSARGLDEPSVALAEGHCLHPPFRRGVDPPDIDRVDPDAVEAMRMRGVFR